MNWQTLIDFSTQADTCLSPDSNTLIALPELAVIAVTGEEASSFLQNLLTNDVNQLQASQAQLTGLCNPKGRLLALFQLFKQAEQDYLLILPAELATAIIQRLTMFKLRSKVDIQRVEEMTALGWLTPETSLSLPAHAGEASNHAGAIVIKQTGEIARYLVLTTTAAIDAFTASINNVAYANAASWHLQEIMAGIPAIFTDTKESFTPQQINLDLIGGVSFKKGCYPGQEVVARLHYLGSPSRRLFLAKLDQPLSVQPNSVVSDNDGEVQGHVVHAQATADQCLSLVSMKLSAVDKTLLINNVSIHSLTALADDS